MMDSALNVEIDPDGFDFSTVPPAFALRRNRYMRQFHATKAEDKRGRAGWRRLIQPSNAGELSLHLPGPNECTHAVVRGDFVMADVIPVLMRTEPAETLVIATLGMSTSNAKFIAGLITECRVNKVLVLVSHYFSRVDKTGTFREVIEILGDRVKVARTHAKVILLKVGTDSYVIEGSANLRSSDNIEQFAIWNDAELFAWHIEWIEEVANG